MKGAGIALSVLGGLMLLFAMVIDTSIDSGSYLSDGEILNIGLLQNQLMAWQGGIGAIVAGSVLFSVGSLVKLIAAVGVLNDSEQAEPVVIPATAACDWCGRDVAYPSQPCSQFDAETLRLTVGTVKDDECLAELKTQDVLPENYEKGQSLS